jgi:MFS transporter, DHA1 family, inner membrane transport protein
VTRAETTVGARWLLVAVLIAGAFTTALNIMLIGPLLTAIAAEFGRSEAATGQVATLTAAASGVTALVAAPWMDRWSRRTWLRLECGLLVVGTAISALAPSFGWLLAGRVVAGIGGAVIFANCLAATGDLFPDSARRNRVIGLVSTAATVAGLLGLPLITQIEAATSWRWAMASLLLPIALVLVGTRWLPAGAVATRGPLWSGWWSGYRGILARTETVWLVGLMVVQAVVWFGWFIYLGAFAEKTHGMGPGLLTALFLVGGTGDVVASNFAPVLVRRWGACSVAAAMTAILAMCLLGVGVVFTSQATLFVFAAVAGAAGGALFICASILTLDSYPEGRGAVMSLQSAALEVGGAFGTAGFGAALALRNDYALTYRLLGVVAALALVCLVMSARRAREIRGVIGMAAP